MSGEVVARPGAAVAGAAVAGALLAFSPGTASAWCQLTTQRPDGDAQGCAEDGVPLRWGRDHIAWSLQRDAARDLTREVVEATVGDAFDAWTALACGVDLTVAQSAEDVDCDRPFHDPEGPNSNFVAFVDDWAERDYSRLALATTTVWFGVSSGQILDADMEINQRNYTVRVCPSPLGCAAGAEMDLPSVVTHEVGHFFGLAHSDVPEATMYPRTSPGSVSLRTLADDDVEGMCAIYGGLDLPTSGFAPRNGFTPACGPVGGGGGGGGGCAAGGSPAGAAGAAAAGLLALAAIRRRAGGRVRKITA